jgi:DNA-binding GntR family transcriptional regulator
MHIACDSFHHVLVRASGNNEIQHVLDRLMPKVRRLECAQFGSLAVHTSVLHHQAIIAACEQRLTAMAATLTEQNWLSLGQLIVQSLDDRTQRSKSDT